MRTVELADGTAVPVLGQGSWKMGDDRSRRGEEIAALRAGLDLGMTLIDTAEMYGSGRSEELVAEAIWNRRDEVFLVSKVMPGNASRNGTIEACEASLRRLRTDCLDLYLLHWPGSTPFAETLEGFETLRRDGKIRRWGVSNFDVAEMDDAAKASPEPPATNQVQYSLQARGVEHDLMPRLREAGVPLMAYSPLGQGGRMLRHPSLERIAERHGVASATVALAFLVGRPNVFAVPKSGSTEHVRANAAAADLTLTDEDRAELDEAFPPPRGRTPLSII